MKDDATIGLNKFEDFLKRKVNSHEIGYEFEITDPSYYYEGNSTFDYWGFAEVNGYVKRHSTDFGVRIKILKHYEIPPYEAYFDEY